MEVLYAVFCRAKRKGEMRMLGTWVNVAAGVNRRVIGLLIQKGLSQRLADTLMKGLALCTITIGISGALGGSDTLKLILSVVIGALLGELLDLDGKIQRLGAWVERRFSKEAGGVSIAEGFVTAQPDVLRRGHDYRRFPAKRPDRRPSNAVHQVHAGFCFINDFCLFFRARGCCSRRVLYWCFKEASPCWRGWRPRFWAMRSLRK